MKHWVITDIHGCAKTFEALLERINYKREDTLYLLGDYIDRGSDSKGVLDLILLLQQTRHQIHCLLGNHELMMLYALENPTSQQAFHWIRFNGGAETLRSFNADTVDDIDDKYIDFIDDLSYYFEVDKFILVHAGLNLAIEDPFSDEDAMLWIRGKQKINHSWLGDRIIIHGHTPQARQQVEKNVEQMDNHPIVDIDSGCVYPRKGLHHLSALELFSRELIFQENIDD